MCLDTHVEPSDRWVFQRQRGGAVRCVAVWNHVGNVLCDDLVLGNATKLDIGDRADRQFIFVSPFYRFAVSLLRLAYPRVPLFFLKLLSFLSL